MWTASRWCPWSSSPCTRDFAYDETQVLGKAGEEESIRQAIASDLVGLVTRRLTAVR